MVVKDVLTTGVAVAGIPGSVLELQECTYFVVTKKILSFVSNL